LLNVNSILKIEEFQIRKDPMDLVLQDPDLAAHSFPKMFKCLHVPRYGSELKPVLTQKILIPIPNFLKMGLK
jgi:hypothetical protein